MIRVAFETSTPVGSVAVGRADRVLAEVSLGLQTRHAETLLPALDAALGLVGVDRPAIEEVVVGAGPGSFTGVRVAAATAKALAHALDRPLRAYSSLLALAAAVPTGPVTAPVCALFDARREEVYAGCWTFAADGWTEQLAPTVGPLAEILEATSSGPEGPPTVYVGEGARRYRAVLVEAGVLDPSADVPALAPRASTLVRLAEAHPEAGSVPEPRRWEPLYVRGSSAERGVAG